MTSEIATRKNRERTPKKEFKPAEFVNYDLTDDDKTRFKAWYSAKSFDGWALIDKLLSAGYALSIKPDDYHECVACFISPVSDKNPNYGAILTGRGRSSTMAVLGSLFRHYILFEELWPERHENRSPLDDD